MPIQRLAALLVLLVPAAFAQMPAAKPKAAPTLRSILLEQLRSTHNKAEWFVPVNTAVEGLTAEQAKWVPMNAAGKLDPNANHSVGQLANHLLFWDTESLAKFNGEKPPEVGNNDETFNSFDAATWSATVTKLDAVLTAWEQAVEQADDAKLAKWASTIAHIGTHNAYHTGQMMYVRKLQGSFDAAKGVK